MPRTDQRPRPAPRRPSAGQAQGFSLIEVLVALTILAMTMGAMMEAAGYYANQTGYFRERTLAHWVAMNVVTEWQLENKWPDVGEISGEEEMAGRVWHWRVTVEETAEASMRRMRVDVVRELEVFSRLLEEQSYLASLDAYLLDPS